MTLEQFADLMAGLGYSAERGEREKPAKVVAPAEMPESPETTAEQPAEASTETVEAEASVAPEVNDEMVEAKPAEEDTKEVFFIFTWGGNRGAQQQRRDKPQGKGQGKPRGKGKPKRQNDASNKPRSYEARPKKKDTIDPDNPFAKALMGLKDKGS